MRKDHKALMRAVTQLTDRDLRKPLRPGRKETIYYLLHGIVQHDIYHAGQIAVMKKAD